MRILVCLVLGLLVVGSAAIADEVVLKDGRVIEGRVVSRTDGDVVIRSVVGLNEVTTTLKSSEIEAVRKGRSKAEDLLAEHKRRLAKINPQRPADWYRLAMWMKQQDGFEAAAAKAFARALELDPNHALTRKELGYVKGPDGEWSHGGDGAEAKPDADREAHMLAELMNALGLIGEEDARKELPWGVHPFEELNYRFYREGVARNEYLGLRYLQYGLPGMGGRGTVADLVTRQPFNHLDYFDEVVDPLSGTTTLVPRDMPAGASVPPIGAVWLDDVPAYNEAAGRFGWPTIPQIGITPRVPIQE